mmetsp:Transcript_107670/g.347523  ORF Transcript_107670/g.347523 Transcript_107670/m.347523 type:complete len:221 (+) Transcript_107670:606-1268(+)
MRPARSAAARRSCSASSSPCRSCCSFRRSPCSRLRSRRSCARLWRPDSRSASVVLRWRCSSSSARWRSALVAEALARSACKRPCSCRWRSRCSSTACCRAASTPSARCLSSRQPSCFRSRDSRSRRHWRNAAACRCAAYFKASQCASCASSCSRVKCGNSRQSRSMNRSRRVWSCCFMKRKRECACSSQSLHLPRKSANSSSSCLISWLTRSFSAQSSLW